MKKVFVTGGSGFVGKNLLRQLTIRGIEVNALARSQTAMDAVRLLGANPIEGDLGNFNAFLKGCTGCDTVFHLAAKVELEGTLEEFRKINVTATKDLLKAARQSGVKTFIHCSTEAVLVGGSPLTNADETTPYPDKPAGLYPITKGEAERAVLAEFKEAQTAKEDFRAIVVRPRLIYGPGDTVFLPAVLKMISKGDFKWISGGNYLTSTTHVRNVVEGLLLAAEKGRGGEIYFVTDGKPMQFREFVTKLVATQGVDLSKIGSVPYWAAYLGTFVGMLPYSALRLTGEQLTINDSKARNELGYTGSVTFESALEEIRQEYENQKSNNNNNNNQHTN